MNNAYICAYIHIYSEQFMAEQKIADMDYYSEIKQQPSR